MAYIDVDELLRTLPDDLPYKASVKRVLLQAHEADVVEVVHGKWAHIDNDEWCCTNCGEVITTEGSWEVPTRKYCNECGAKMDGERKRK